MRFGSAESSSGSCPAAAATVSTVVGEHAVQKRKPAGLRQLSGHRTDDLCAEGKVAEQATLLAQPDFGAVGELTGLAYVMQEGGGHDQIRVEPRMQLTELAGKRRHGDRVLEEAAKVGVVSALRARGATQLGCHRLRAGHPLNDRPQAGVVDLSGEMLEKALELVNRPIGHREELLGLPLVRLQPCDLVELRLKLAAKYFDPPANADRLAAIEARGNAIGIAKHSRRNGPGAISKLEHEIRRAVA